MRSGPEPPPGGWPPLTRSEGPTAVMRTDIRDANPEPKRLNFADSGAYTRAWYAWRAFNRDHEMTPAEAEMRWLAIEAELRRRMGLPPAEEDPWTDYKPIGDVLDTW